MRKECEKYQTSNLSIPAKAVALVEPFKVRTITKGAAVPYYLCKYYQKAMWNCLQSNDMFKLTGTPLDDTVIAQFVWQNTTTPGDYVSADYSSATDLLDPLWSERALEALFIHNDWDLRDFDICRRALVDHMISVPVGKRSDPKLDRIVKQERGQLMGSPISFPILCLLNATACHAAAEARMNETYWGDSFRNIVGTSRWIRRPFKLLVNGDDALFKIDSEGYSLWKNLTKYVGLELSVGKNYYHPSVVTLNSQCYTIEYDNNVPDIVRIPYFNMGLVCGQKRVIDTSSDDPDKSSLGAQCRALLDLHKPDVVDPLLSRFIVNHPQLKEERERPWFAPECLGGMGLPVIRDGSLYSKLGQSIMSYYYEKLDGQPRFAILEPVRTVVLRSFREQTELEKFDVLHVKHPSQERILRSLVDPGVYFTSDIPLRPTTLPSLRHGMRLIKRKALVRVPGTRPRRSRNLLPLSLLWTVGGCYIRHELSQNN
jgi:hypothetical protein